MAFVSLGHSHQDIQEERDVEIRNGSRGSCLTVESAGLVTPVASQRRPFTYRLFRTLTHHRYCDGNARPLHKLVHCGLARHLMVFGEYARCGYCADPPLRILGM